MKAMSGLRVSAVRDLRVPLLCVATAAALLLNSSIAGAGTATNTFTVQAQILAACNVSATNLNFGTYDPTSATALTGTSTVSVYCTSGTTFTTALNVGSGGGTFTTRTLASGSNTLNYNLYKDTNRTTVWGDGTGSTATVAGTGAGLLTAVAIPVYGQIAVSQDKPVGTYTSTITVTITY